MTNNLLEEIAAKIAVLPVKQQLEALAFVETLAAREQNANHQDAAFQSVRGILRGDLEGLDQDLSDVRAEMWRNFPREELS